MSIQRLAPFPFNNPSDFVIRTCNGTPFNVSAIILSLASPFFNDLPRDPPNPAEEFVFDVPETDLPIETMLRFAYPVPDPILYDLDDIVEAFLCAKKYQVQLATTALGRMLLAPRFIEVEPVRVYAIARRFELSEIWDLAAFHACKTSRDWPYYEDFTHISGAQYHALNAYHRRRGAEAVRLLENTTLCEEPCTRCGKKWEVKYKKRAEQVLIEAPTSDKAFSNAFVAKCAADMGCITCSHDILQAMAPKGSLSKLKSKVATIYMPFAEGQCSVYQPNIVRIYVPAESTMYFKS